MSIKIIVDVVSFFSNTLTVVVSSIAIYVFFAKKKEITAAFNLLINFSYQTTLNEIRGKLDRLNEYNVKEAEDIAEIKNIMHEICGQIRGNIRLTTAAPELAQKFENLANGKKLTEPNKRSLVSETREFLKNIDVSNVENIIGG